MSADGNWKITVNTPMGAQVVTANIVTRGDTFTGSTVGPMGDHSIEGTVDGDKLEFAAVVSGDSMTGNVKLGGFGNAGMTGERV